MQQAVRSPRADARRGPPRAPLSPAARAAEADGSGLTKRMAE
jgi:hypothetical protein